MYLLLGLIVGVSTFAFVTVYGFLFVDGGRMSLARDKGVSQVDSRDHQTFAPAFQPLDLGGVAIQWPSEVKHPTTARPLPPWPSETWTDGFFGPGRGGKPPISSERPVERPVESAEEARFYAENTPAPPPPEPKKKLKQAQAKPPAKKAAKAPARSSGGAMSDDELVELVEKSGLAAAVEALRARTGQDFQQAAQHIAQVLRNRRSRG